MNRINCISRIYHMRKSDEKIGKGHTGMKAGVFFAAKK